jgi:Protein  of unknown function (DUF3018)
MSQPKKPPLSDNERRAARRERERRYRDKRAQGLRRVVIWVPDRNHPRFEEECRRQSLLAAQTDANEEWLDAWMVGQDSTGWIGNE